MKLSDMKIGETIASDDHLESTDIEAVEETSGFNGPGVKLKPMKEE